MFLSRDNHHAHILSLSVSVQLRMRFFPLLFSFCSFASSSSLSSATHRVNCSHVCVCVYLFDLNCVSSRAAAVVVIVFCVFYSIVSPMRFQTFNWYAHFVVSQYKSQVYIRFRYTIAVNEWNCPFLYVSRTCYTCTDIWDLIDAVSINQNHWWMRQKNSSPRTRIRQTQNTRK